MLTVDTKNLELKTSLTLKFVLSLIGLSGHADTHSDLPVVTLLQHLQCKLQINQYVCRPSSSLLTFHLSSHIIGNTHDAAIVSHARGLYEVCIAANNSDNGARSKACLSLCRQRYEIATEMAYRLETQKW